MGVSLVWRLLRRLFESQGDSFIKDRKLFFFPFFAESLRGGKISNLDSQGMSFLMLDFIFNYIKGRFFNVFQDDAKLRGVLDLTVSCK